MFTSCSKQLNIFEDAEEVEITDIGLYARNSKMFHLIFKVILFGSQEIWVTIINANPIPDMLDPYPDNFLRDN